MAAERVIVDAADVLDPRLKKVQEALAEGKFIGFRVVYVTVDDTRVAIEVCLNAERKAILAAVREAGLTVLEDAKKVER
ncbi:MAG: hypothetical protein ABIH78_04955 [Candidatus Peregrinibacteria bacterium]